MPRLAPMAAPSRRRRADAPERGTLRDEQRRLTRRRLADAALELFEEIGYGAATADGIAKRAGANRATFYLHYASKADLVLELMDRVDAEVMGIFAAAGAMEEPTPAEVRVWLEDTFGFWERHRALIDANQQAMPAEPAVAAQWWAGMQRMVDAMPRLLEGLDGEERERRRIILLGALLQLERLCYFVVIAGAPLDRERTLDVLAAEWTALLRSRPATGPR